MPNYPGKTKGTRRITVYHQGKQLEKVIRGSLRDGDEYEARWKLELRQSGVVDPKIIPLFSTFCVERYAPYARANLKASTWNKVRKYQVDSIVKKLGHLRLTGIRFEDVESFKGARKRDGNRASSINNELRVLRTIWNFALDLGYPMPRIKWKRVKVRGEGRAKAWSLAQVQSIYTATVERYPILLPMMVFLMNTGCRKGEAIACEWDWVDEPQMMIRIPSNEFWQPKNGLPREVPMTESVRSVLVRRHPKYVFPNRNGDRYVDFPKDIWWEIVEAAGVTGGPHQFRHTFASHFLAKRPDLFLLAQVLGHSHQRVTELYSHMLPDHLEKARNVVDVAPAFSLPPENSG